ncbi:MAG: hypothetical protein EBR82_69535, partial [Caulobacteraceae bacterium]|nr:hypothetical protein [Caulobacteraceae bacterium]
MTDSALALATPQASSLGIWANPDAFDQGQRMAAALAGSSILPDCYRADKAGGKQALSNCLMLLSLAQRLQMDPFLVGQNMVPINGRPAFSSAFVIALINQSGRFTPLRFSYSGAGDTRACVASATDVRSGTELAGNPVSVKMAKDYGWYGRSGSQWAKNTDQLLAYRAAGWFGRLHCPEVLLGVATREEIVDAVIDIEPEPAPAPDVVMVKGSEEPAPAAVTEPEPEPAPAESAPPTFQVHNTLKAIASMTTPTALT